MSTLSLAPVNALVYRVLTCDGSHVGNLKRIGALWKFKAVGYEPDGAVVPGGGPFTEHHNAAFDVADAGQLTARLLPA
jgi:hypothetical protein